MRILSLAHSDAGDGAAVAAVGLHRALRRLGHGSVLFVERRKGDNRDPAVIQFVPAGSVWARAMRVLRGQRIRRQMAAYASSRRRAGFVDYLFTGCRSVHGLELLDQLPACDVLNVHGVTAFMDFAEFFRRVPRRAPVVRILHDMQFLTGGCHHNLGCGRYVQGCGRCPQLGSRRPRDLSRRNWEEKFAVLNHVDSTRMHLVVASNWLAEAARRSPLVQKFPLAVIPYGVDVDVFQPRDRRAGRDVLGIPQDARVVLFVVGGSLDFPLKGFARLVEALGGLADVSDLVLMTVGVGSPSARVPVPHVHLGLVQNRRLLSLVYSAADVVVVPSEMEAFSNAALEAQACGTPVVAFRVGGLAESVDDGRTGFLVPPRDVGALRAAIRQVVLDDGARTRMAQACRQRAVEEFSLELHARRYVSLYETILSHGRLAAADASSRVLKNWR